MMSQHYITETERLRKKAIGLIQIIKGTYSGSIADASEILRPEVFESYGLEYGILPAIPLRDILNEAGL